MGMDGQGSAAAPGAVRIAHAFMRAFWDGDLVQAERWLTTDAAWVFQPSMPYAAEGAVWPARAAMRRIVADLFGAFDADAGFDVTVTHAFGDATNAALEYRAAGRLADGRDYANIYAACFTARDGKVAEVRPYNDTRHMFALIGVP